MKKWIVASRLIIGMTPAVLAAEKFFVTVDTVGNCSVHQSPPSAGKTAIGHTGGYHSLEAAKQFLDEIRNDESKCKACLLGEELNLQKTAKNGECQEPFSPRLRPAALSVTEAHGTVAAASDLLQGAAV